MPGATMKKKILGLAPLKVPSKSDIRSAVRTPQAFLDYSPPPSPLSTRPPPLSPKTEHELRIACTVVFHGQPAVTDGPAHTRSEKTRSKELQDRNSQCSQYKSRYPAEVSMPPFALSSSSKFSYRPAVPDKDMIHPADMVRTSGPVKAPKRRDSGIKSPEADPVSPRPKTSQAIRRPDPEASKSSAQRPQSQDRSRPTMPAEPADTGNSSPRTDTTADYHWNAQSTAPTSIAITPARSARMSKNDAAILPNDSALSSQLDSTAAEWMKHELEKRRAKYDADDRFGHVSATPMGPNHVETEIDRARPPSRATSIRDGIMNYIKPGSSRHSSRPASRSESRASMDRASINSRSSSTSDRWRSWSLTRRVNSGWSSWRSNSRPGSSDGKDDSRGRGCKRTEINLNRPLPKLPGLDQWKDDEQETPTEKPSHSTHIAGLMRKDLPEQPADPFAAARSLQSSPNPLRLNPTHSYQNSLVSKTNQSISSDPANGPSPRVASPTHPGMGAIVNQNPQYSPLRKQFDFVRTDTFPQRAEPRPLHQLADQAKAATFHSTTSLVPSEGGSSLHLPAGYHALNSQSHERLRAFSPAFPINEESQPQQPPPQHQQRQHQPQQLQQSHAAQLAVASPVKESSSGLKKLFGMKRLGRKTSKLRTGFDEYHPSMYPTPGYHHYYSPQPVPATAAAPVIRY